MATASNKVFLPSDDESTIKVTPSRKDSKDKPTGQTIKLKKPAPKHTKPGNWRDGSVIDEDTKKKGTSTPASASSVPASPGPIVTPLDSAALDNFPTGRPLETPEHFRCIHCKKMITKSIREKHVASCLKSKKEKAQRKKEAKEARDRERREAEKEKDDDGDTKMESGDEEEGVKGLKSSKKSAAGKNIGGGKKRKAEGEKGEGPKLKKKKEEAKPKLPKTRGPIDVERQCGVLKDGVQCARSLTCKSHSMGAKRSVPGRSLPYDMLLAAYQKKNQAKQQKAAIDASAPLEEDDADKGPVDSDEELQGVMLGVGNWNPLPLVVNGELALRWAGTERVGDIYRKERLREQLLQATNGGLADIFKVRGFGAQKLEGHVGLFGEIDAEDEGAFTANGMSMPGGSTAMGLAARRASGFQMQIQMPGGVPAGGGQRRQSNAGQR